MIILCLPNFRPNKLIQTLQWDGIQTFNVYQICKYAQAEMFFFF